MRKTVGTVSQQVIVRVLDDPGGTPELGVTSATGGLALYFWRRGALLSSFTIVSTLGGLASAFDAGGLTSIINGYYRVDPPNSAFATGSSGVFVGGFATSMIIVGQDFELVTDDTEELAAQLVTVSAAIDALADLTQDQVSTIVNSIFNTYDPPTRTEATADKASLIAEFALLNDITQNQVSTIVTSVVNTYDGPTRTEATADKASLIAEFALLNDLTAAQVNAEVDTALVDIHLDHWLAVSMPTGVPVNGAGLAVMAAVAGTFADFDDATDSLEAIRDRGDAAWLTGGGGTASAIASAVWDDHATRVLTAGTNLNDISQDQVSTIAVSAILDHVSTIAASALQR